MSNVLDMYSITPVFSKKEIKLAEQLMYQHLLHLITLGFKFNDDTIDSEESIDQHVLTTSEFINRDEFWTSVGWRTILYINDKYYDDKKDLLIKAGWIKQIKGNEDSTKENWVLFYSNLVSGKQIMLKTLNEARTHLIIAIEKLGEEFYEITQRLNVQLNQLNNRINNLNHELAYVTSN